MICPGSRRNFLSLKPGEKYREKNRSISTKKKRRDEDFYVPDDQVRLLVSPIEFVPPDRKEDKSNRARRGEQIGNVLISSHQ
jgi:hypothetical protein